MVDCDAPRGDYRVRLHGDDRPDHREERWRDPRPPFRHNGVYVCYRLGALAAGRTTVDQVAYRSGRVPDGGIGPGGESLLAVLVEHRADLLARDEWECRQDWNVGAGSIDRDEVEEHRALLARTEALRRALDG